MLKTVFFGGSSLSSNKPPAPKTQGKVWQVTIVTPGAIAFMVILVFLFVIHGYRDSLMDARQFSYIHPT